MTTAHPLQAQEIRLQNNEMITALEGEAVGGVFNKLRHIMEKMNVIAYLFRILVMGPITSNNKATLASSGWGEWPGYVETKDGCVSVKYKTYRVRTRNGRTVDATVCTRTDSNVDPREVQYKVLFPGAAAVDSGCKGTNNHLAILAIEEGKNFISLNFPGAGTNDSSQIVNNDKELCDNGVEAITAICEDLKALLRNLDFVGFSTGGAWAFMCSLRMHELFRVKIKTTVLNTFGNFASVVKCDRDGSNLYGTGVPVRFRWLRKVIFSERLCQWVVRSSGWALDSTRTVFELLNCEVFIHVIQADEDGTMYEKSDRGGCVIGSGATLSGSIRSWAQEHGLNNIEKAYLKVTEPGRHPHGGKNYGLLIRQAVADAFTSTQCLAY